MTGQGHAPGLVLWVRRRVINVATDLAVTFSDEEEHVQVRRRETKGGASYLLCRECVVACAVAVYSSTIYLNSHTVSFILLLLLLLPPASGGAQVHQSTVRPASRRDAARCTHLVQVRKPRQPGKGGVPRRGVHTEEDTRVCVYMFIL